MSSVAVSKRIADMRAELDVVMTEPIDGSAAERAAAIVEFEKFLRQLPAMQHRLVNGLAEVPAEELGEPSMAAALSTLLRISREEANRRIKEAKDLGPRAALTGEPLDPLLAHTAAAQARGDIGFEHVKIIRKFFKKLPGFVDHDTREAAENQLADLACGLGPEQLHKAADRLAMILDQDGELSDADRAKRSYLAKGRQRADGMSELRGCADAELSALLDAVFAKWSAPGMCNPDDEAPCIDGEPSTEAIRKDLRTAGQRNHDALKALCRALLASGQLGSHKGLPVTMVVSTTLKELESGAGHAVTGGGTLLPIREVIKQASAAHQYLCVFDDHTEEPLYLGRAKRLASKAQRLVLYARDRGCTFPGCTAPAYHSEAHHRNGDWSQGGLTNIDDLTLACGTDNRRVKPGGWTTRTRKDGRTEWLPPPNLDTGQRRVNNYHHPERYLIPDEHATENSGDDEGGERP
jgi:Domain of unknown function (DUF222)